MTNINYKSAAEPQYEAPAVAVLEIENENTICTASTQQFEKSSDDGSLFDW